MPTNSTLRTLLHTTALAVTLAVSTHAAWAQQRPPYGTAVNLETAKKIGVLTNVPDPKSVVWSHGVGK